MKHYIYALLDNNDNPFYVGKSTNPNRRRHRHLQFAKNGSKFHVYNKIRKILRENPDFNLSVEILEECEEKNVDEREQYHIKDLRSKGVRLTNMTEGGEGGCSSESAKKGVETKRKNGTLALSEEHKKKVGDALRGKPKSKQHKKALSEAWNRSPEQLKEASKKAAETSRGKINIKKYICTDPEGNEYVTERGLTDFCREHGLTQALLSKVARGERQHHKGWKARYAD